MPSGASLCHGQYTIDRYLDAGGFGVTYLARDSLGRRVVIKECFPSAMCFRTNQTVCLRSQGNVVEFDAILELFEKEARALAALQHPYIVGVHQYFRDNGTAYMAMDFVEGCTLLDIIENDPARLTPAFVKKLLIQMLHAVHYIHRHDILHRDISPDNILIDESGLPVLIDFGAAREDSTKLSRVLSKVLTVKDGYSPQEFYLAGSKQVYASDLYALAATFYHAVTHNAPPNSTARMSAAARDAADPLSDLVAVDGYDRTFLAAITKCLGLFAKDRLQSADHWLEVIDEGVRQKKLLREAAKDRDIDRSVARLVQDFFKDFPPKPPIEPAPTLPKLAPPPATPKAAMPQIVRAPEGSFAREPAPKGQDLEPDIAGDLGGDLGGDLDMGAATDVVRPRRVHAPDLIGPPAPHLSPIEKMRLKYAKPPQPEPAPAAPEPQGFFAQLGRRWSMSPETPEEPA